MTREQILRILAGAIVLISLLLADYFENSNWLWLTAFVGANLFQSGFTGILYPRENIRGYKYWQAVLLDRRE